MFPLIAENMVITQKEYTILGPINLTIKEGGINVVLGPNGSGKTTLLKGLHGIVRLQKGSVRWSISKKESIEKQMFVFQSPVMLRRSVLENLVYPLKLKKVPKAQALCKAEEWAKKISMSNFIHQKATRLSQGEKQKLALARALITLPKMLFLDEPSASLDGQTTIEIERLLNASLKLGTTIIMSTHDIGQAKRLANNILFLKEGKLESIQSAEEFFKNPKSTSAKKFIAGNIV